MKAVQCFHIGSAHQLITYKLLFVVGASRISTTTIATPIATLLPFCGEPLETTTSYCSSLLPSCVSGEATVHLVYFKNNPQKVGSILLYLRHVHRKSMDLLVLTVSTDVFVIRFLAAKDTHTMSFRRLSLVLLLAINLFFTAIAEDAGNDDGAYEQYYESNGVRNWDGFGAGDNSITYWTDYAILPKRCIV